MLAIIKVERSCLSGVLPSHNTVCFEPLISCLKMIRTSLKHHEMVQVVRKQNNMLVGGRSESSPLIGGHLPNN